MNCTKACYHIINETQNPDIRRLGTEFFVDYNARGCERILIDNFHSVEFELCSTSKQLIRLAYNLFNGYTSLNSTFDMSPCGLFYGLDSNNCRIVSEAIAIYLLD